MTDDPVVRFRRIADDPKPRRVFKHLNERWELQIDDGPIQVIKNGDLERAIPGKVWPADMWPCVHAANERFAAGDLTTWTIYP